MKGRSIFFALLAKVAQSSFAADPEHHDECCGEVIENYGLCEQRDGIAYVTCYLTEIVVNMASTVVIAGDHKTIVGHETRSMHRSSAAKNSHRSHASPGNPENTALPTDASPSVIVRYTSFNAKTISPDSMMDTETRPVTPSRETSITDANTATGRPEDSTMSRKPSTASTSTTAAETVAPTALSLESASSSTEAPTSMEPQSESPSSKPETPASSLTTARGSSTSMPETSASVASSISTSHTEELPPPRSGKSSSTSPSSSSMTLVSATSDVSTSDVSTSSEPATSAASSTLSASTSTPPPSSAVSTSSGDGNYTDFSTSDVDSAAVSSSPSPETSAASESSSSSATPTSSPASSSPSSSPSSSSTPPTSSPPPTTAPSSSQSSTSSAPASTRLPACPGCDASPGKNKCDPSTSCIDFNGITRCACRAGYKGEDESTSYRVPSTTFGFLVFVPQGTTCNVLCTNQSGSSKGLCGEVEDAEENCDASKRSG